MITKLYGQIKDSIAHAPLGYANIMVLRDEKSILSLRADDSGRFEIQLDPLGEVSLKISTVGYKQKFLKNIQMPNGGDKVNVGTILLAKEDMLETVNITKKLTIVENRLDKMIYHVAKDPFLMGSTGEDVFRRLPMVSLGYDGKVSLRGNQQVKILIDGKPSGTMSGNIADALRMIPSDQIKSVEIMTNPSLKYDMDAGAGIINIITNRRKMKGINGGVAGTLGTRQSNMSSNLAGRMGRFGITGSIGNSWSYPVASLITSENVAASNETVFTQDNHSRNRRNGTQLAVAMDYELDSMNMFVSNINFNKLVIATGNEINSVYPRSKDEYLGYVDNEQPISNFDFSADYIRQFRIPGKEMALSFQYLNGRNDLKYKSDYGSQTEFGSNVGENDEYTAQLDFKYPIRSISVDFGAKIVKRNIRSVVAIDTLDQQPNRIPDLQRSYAFKYNQNVMAGYATIILPIGKAWNVNGGLRWEKTMLKGNDMKDLSHFVNSAGSFFPNITFSYTHSKKSIVKILYGKRIQRPSLYYLNPYRNSTDKTYQMQGNPKLKSEIIHNIEIGGDFSFVKHSGQVNVSMYYKTICNMIGAVAQNRLEHDKIIVLQTFENIGKNKTVGINFYGSLMLFKRLRLKANVDLYAYSNLPYGDLLKYTTEPNRTYMVYKTFVGMDLNIGKGFTFDSSLFYDSPQRTFQGEYAAFNLWNVSLKKRVLKETAVIGITVVDPFNDIKNLQSYSKTEAFIQKSNFSIPFRSFGISFSWQFGKNKPDIYRSKKKQINNDDQKLSVP